jgi:hypothetical protein
MEIGYIGYSKDLSHPADRRRIAIWNSIPGNRINTESPLEGEMLLLSNAANLGFWIKKSHKPVVLDLVDAYLASTPNFFVDFLRNLLRTFSGTSNFKWLTYTRHLKYACTNSDAIIVASDEQRNLLAKYNSKIFVIQDDHSEIDVNLQVNGDLPHARVDSKWIYWDGFGFTLKHFEHISKQLDLFLSKNDWQLKLITNVDFPRWGNRFGKVRSEDLISKWFPTSRNRVQIIPWSVENVLQYSSLASFSIVPIDVDDLFAKYKSENKLLAMIHLNLPVLFSNTPAYSRIARDASLSGLVEKPTDWLFSLEEFSTNIHRRQNDESNGRIYINNNHTLEILIRKWQIMISEIVES